MNIAFARQFYCKNKKRIFFCTIKNAEFFSCKNECENKKFKFKKFAMIEKKF